MKKIILLVTMTLTLVQCKKPPFSDLSGTYTLKGTVVIEDTLNGPYNMSLAKNLKVYLRYSGNSAGYIYSLQANSQAQYTFSGIDKDRNYTIYASTDTGTTKYYGKLDYAAGRFADGQSDTLKLFPSITDQTGIHLLVLDSLGGRVPNVTAWVFNSPVLFVADSSEGRAFDMRTNDYGVANKYNIAIGTYYLRVKTRIGVVPLAGEGNVIISGNGVKTVVVTVRSIPLDRNGIELTVLDSHLAPVNNASVFFYRSSTISDLDTACTNSLFTLMSNGSGLASTYIIDSSLYYFKARKIIGHDTLQNKGSIHVGLTGIARGSVIIN
jgi:hypothetical protein